MNGFIDFITHQCGVRPDDSILVGVSGGIDSVTLLNLLVRYGFRPVIAHCNFSLRGEESDEDENLVVSLSLKYHLPIEQIRFNTIEYARKNRISIEMAARDLRYSWFRRIAASRNCKWIAVAHHRDDNIETFFLNLIRGAGLNGLSGMKAVSGSLIRPLLFASREEIVTYATEHFLAYRNDSSNADTIFLRNKIRHEILPFLETINPSLRNHLVRTIQILADANKIVQEKTDALQVIAKETEKEILLPIIQLKEIIGWPSLLFEFLRQYEFSPSVVNDIVQTIDGPSGACFFSPTHLLVRDRGKLIISVKKDKNDEFYTIAKGQKELIFPLHLQIDQFSIEGYHISRESQTACFDYDVVKFPLILRHWEKGDYFYPFGMNGQKKISDYFIDNKFSLNDKENTWLLCADDGSVLWIVGHRTDNRYRVTSKTKSILQIILAGC